IGQPHTGVSGAVETARTMSTTALGPSKSHAKSLSQTTLMSKIKRSEEEIPARCRVGLDLIGLLVGSGGHDAMGREVGVGPGEAVEAAGLNNRSQIAQWVMGRLKLGSVVAGRTSEYAQNLCFDETHCTGAASISGTR
ncbi:unnamed protein product, partial [Sphacelaria rigidula]